MTLPSEILKSFRGFNSFTFSDVRTMLASKHKNISEKTIQVTLSRMVKKQSIYPIVKGVFTMQKRDELAGFAFSPFYYGGLAALMIRDMVDDQVRMEVMTTRNVKRSSVTIYRGASRIVLHHIPNKYYFGFEDVKYGNLVVPVSTAEKTLIDLFYYKRRMPLQNYSSVLQATNTKKLNEYLKLYDGHTRKAVIKFVGKYKRAAELGELEKPY